MKLSYGIVLIINIYTSSSCMFTFDTVASEQTKNYFLKRFFETQSHLMSVKQYTKYINPYLDKAEKTLEIPAACFGNKQDLDNYCSILIAYYTAQFKYIINKKSTKNTHDILFKEQADSVKKHFLITLQELCTKYYIDINKERIDTIEILDQAIQRYYDMLHISSKTYLYLSKDFYK